MPTIETLQGTIYFADHRKKETRRTPVILVHGAGGSRLDWPGEIRRMAEANALVVDLPGHGKSPGPGRDTIDNYAADIIAMMGHLGISRAIIAGHSMGGAIALKAALAFPAHVAGLILIGTGAKLSVHPRILEGILKDPEEVADLLVAWMWGDAATDEMRATQRSQLLTISPEVIYGDYVACNRFDIRDRLPAIHTPSLVIGGTADTMTPHKYSVYLHEHLKDSTLVTVENGGHMMTLEQPEHVAEAIRDWLDQLAQSTGNR